MKSAVAVQNIGVGLCRGGTFGDMLEAMARNAPSQPNEVMARIAPRRNGTISLDPSCRVKFSSEFLSTRFKIPLEGSSTYKRGSDSAVTVKR
jgi:hypothetical protein